MAEKRTKRELEAADLEAKAKAIRRAEKAFWNEVEERLDEVKDRFGLSDKFNDICRTYDARTGREISDLYNYITSSEQVKAYQSRRPAEDGQTDFV